MDKAKKTKSERIKIGSLYLADGLLLRLQLMEEHAEKALRLLSTGKWKAFRSYLSFFLRQLSKPIDSYLSIFGYDYYATGSFIYYREGYLTPAEIRTPIYFIVADGTDLMLFWPLALHELGHCIIDELGYKEMLASRIEDEEVKGEEMAYLIRRLEEVLCDVLATKLGGLSYPYAFMTRIWPLLTTPSDFEYPEHHFRVKCMSLALEEIGFHNEAKNLRSLIKQHIPRHLLEREEVLTHYGLSPQDIIDATRSFRSLLSDRDISDLYSVIKRLPELPSDNINFAYNALWKYVVEFKKSLICRETQQSLTSLYNMLVQQIP